MNPAQIKLFNSVFLLFYSINVYTQELSNLTELIGRQAHARSEAMGRGYTAIYDDHTALFNNPASMLPDTSSFYFSASQLNYPVPVLSDTFKYNYAGIAYQFNKYFSSALSLRHWQLGPAQIDGGYPYSLAFTFTASSEFLENWFAGFNVHALEHRRSSNERIWIYYLDAGLLKKYNLNNLNWRFRHQFSGGISYINFTASNYQIINSYQLPVIFKPAVSYAIGFNEAVKYRGFDPARLLLHFEWQNLLNDELYTSYRIGLEATVMEIFSVRSGFYTESRPDLSEPENRQDNKFTYGLGVYLPIERLSNYEIPLDLFLDFTIMSQSYEASASGIQSPLFYIWSVRLVYK